MRKLMMVALALSACAHQEALQKVEARPAAPPPRLIEVPTTMTYKEARELMQAGDDEGAKARLDVYLAREPKNPAALFDAGWLAEKRGDAAGASEFYRRALAVDSTSTPAALNLARLSREAGRLSEADAVLKAALKAHPDDASLLNAEAVVLRAQTKLAEADAVVHQVLLRHPKDAGAYRNLAAIEADRGHPRLAESALQNARKLDPQDAGIVNALGLLAMKRDDPNAARADFEEATRLDPSFAPAWANLGAIALSYRDYAAAEDAYAKALALDGAAPAPHLAHGWALEGLHKFKEARAEYEAVLAANPKQEDALYGRAVALKAEGDLPAAMEAFKAYAAVPGAAHAKDAQQQIALIDIRLKNPPAQALKERAQKPSPAAELDLSKLPQGTDTGGGSEKLPAETPDPPPAPAAAPLKANASGT